MTDHERLAADVFGIHGSSTPLPGEIDDNAKIAGRDGRTVLLRLSPSGDGVDDIRFRQSVMAAVSDLGTTAPSIIPTLGGDDWALLDDGRVAHMYSWVAGIPFSEAGRPFELAHEIGAVAGTIVEALSDLPRGHRTHDFLWDLADAARVVGDRADTIGDRRLRNLVLRVMARYANVDLGVLPRQVIHNDLNDENLLVSNGSIAGVIDFGDTIETVRIAELAIACTYVMLGQDDPVSVAADTIAGYRSATTLDEAEADVLFDLILTRLATSVVMSASRGDANPHHMVTEALAWDLLERLLAGDVDGIAIELAIKGGSTAEPVSARDDLLVDRSIIGPSLSLAYTDPLNIVRGEGQFLFDERGRRYLDCVNNVCHVGHSNPVVASAGANQMFVLNTNTRYLHAEIIRYGKRILSTLPDHLDRVFLVNSGSEANELAIRLVRSATGRTAMACVDHGYHGHTSMLIDVSPYKFNSIGGSGEPDRVHVLPSPDPYRNTAFGGSGAAVAYRVAADETLVGASLAGLIIEALPGCGGQLIPSGGAIQSAYQAARARGGLVIADEIQTGFGRTGTFWAFERYGVNPDVVTMGKPAGNGHPLALVATTREIAGAFDNGMEYFNTFGGNPVSAAIGNAVLDEIDRLDVQRRAVTVGDHLLTGLESLAERHDAIGDVRGAGLFVGVELVEDRESKSPATMLAREVVEHAKRHGLLLSTDGPFDNVIKIKPPMVFNASDANRVVDAIDRALMTAGDSDQGEGLSGSLDGTSSTIPGPVNWDS